MQGGQGIQERLGINTANSVTFGAEKVSEEEGVVVVVVVVVVLEEEEEEEELFIVLYDGW